MDWLKKFFKELKRVKWPTAKESGKAWSTTVIFIIIVALVLFALATALIVLWKTVGLGV